MALTKVHISAAKYRHNIRKKSVNIKVVNKDDDRVKDVHYCAVCQRPLSCYNPKTGKIEVKHKYLSMYYKGIRAFMCYNCRDCRYFLKKRTGREDVAILELQK